MNKYERRQFFERLCALRDRYLQHGPADSISTMTIAEAVAYAEALFIDTEALDLLVEPRLAIEAQRTHSAE